MANKILKIVFVLFCIVFLAYLSLPNFVFPAPLPGSLQSQEPADLETPLRRGYFTNYTRAEAISWYENQFNHSSFLGLKLPTFLLNYPPEDAQTLIRDQTSSTFLQELVHPFRENIYINGFKPPSHNDEPVFLVGGQHWRQKIIIRSVPSSVWIRLGIFIATAAFVVILFREWSKSLTNKKHEE
ncbi:MAG TPA: hypothetical protein VMR19_03985 [Candidatus Saccharimonadales bacterium]|nr:hypothetical protein [Candidatus Saccharimonadales bacterium]